MKKGPKLFCVFLFAAVGAAANAAGRGPGDGGGGDEVGLEFQASLRSAVEIIRSNGAEFADLARLDWDAMTKNTRILAVNRRLFVVSNGVKQESVALNYPDRSPRLIEVNRARWKNLPSARVKEGIALHEVLSLAGREATGFYPHSAHYLSYFKYAPEPFLPGGPTRGPVAMPTEISKIHPYRCQRRFFEGEGVRSNGVTCTANQHLGFVTAEYTFYLYSRPSGDNFSSKMTEVSYEGPICGLNVSKYTCGFPEEAAFGLAAKAEGAFVMGVSLTGGSVGTEPYGYAALPDSSGNCAPNLVKARPWTAQPMSVIEPYPSSFLNTNGTLNNTVIATQAPANFQVWRQPANTPCNAMGHCSWPDGGMAAAQSVPYMPITPMICVIPKGSLR